MTRLITPTSAPASTSRVDAAIAYARTQIGKPYRWGASGPDAFDCSGLTAAAWQAAGVSIPHFTGAQLTIGSPVSKGDLQPGDLVFTAVNHVQLYSGGGNVIEAPSAGHPVREVPMWGFWTARRLVNPDGTPKSGLPVVGPIADAVTSATSAATSVADPNTWLSLALKLSVFGLGLGLLLVGAAKIVTPAVGAAGDAVTKAVL